VSVHAPHVDTHEHGLQDDCERCAEHAEHPLRSLDASNLRALVGIAHPGQPPYARSETEQIAATAMLNLLEQIGKLAQVAPDELGEYLHDRWHILASFERYSVPRELA
jgi:hypothetical protein